MAEPVLRDPASPEPARRPGPQPVRAASPEAAASEVAKTTAASIDPSHELPPPSAIENESGGAGAASHSATTHGATSHSTSSLSGSDRTSTSERTSAAQAARTRTAAAPPRTATPTRAAAARPVKSRTASQEMLEELHKRLEDLRERVEKQTTGVGMSLRRELNQDADYVKIRARYYHEHRPLQALGIVAAAGFVLGVFVGLWRR